MQSPTVLLKPFNRTDMMPPTTSVRLPTNNNGNEIVLHSAMQLGHQSSKRVTHYHHDKAEFATRDDRCSACRWFEVAIYRTETEYVAWSCGHTIVPGEKPRIRITRTPNEWSIVEFLTVRKGVDAFLPTPSANALAEAAKIDEGILNAYVNRAVP